MINWFCKFFLQDQHIQDLKVAVSAILRDLCQGCDVYPENFEKTILNCSTSGLVAYFSTALIYSNSNGTIVASTLINMLLSWLISEDTSRITVGGSSLELCVYIRWIKIISFWYVVFRQYF